MRSPRNARRKSIRVDLLEVVAVPILPFRWLAEENRPEIRLAGRRLRLHDRRCARPERASDVANDHADRQSNQNLRLHCLALL
jgi:hypothetical protein